MSAVGFIDNSLYYCREKCYYTREQVVSFLQKDCPTVHSRIRYALAKEFGYYLGERHAGIRAIYLYGSTMTDQAGKMSDIDLIILVGEESQSLSDTIQLIDDELILHYQNLLGEGASAPRRLLDVHIVEDAEVNESRGYGTLLGSMFERPIKIWSRKERSTNH